MRRVGALAAALGIGGVAGTILHTDIQGGPFDRGAQVAADIGGKRLERADVDGVQAGGRGGAKLGQCGQKTGKGLAATGGGNQERGGVGGAGQHGTLVGVEGPAFGGEPCDERLGEYTHDGQDRPERTGCKRGGLWVLTQYQPSIADPLCRDW